MTVQKMRTERQVVAKRDSEMGNEEPKARGIHSANSVMSVVNARSERNGRLRGLPISLKSLARSNMIT